MLQLTQVVKSFPSVRIPSRSGGPDVEVSLIAQLGHGAGNHLFAAVASRQRHHGAFIDELDEPSAKLGATDFTKGDATALYSFVVGPKGHPFHRHAGHRIFTAVAGSGGAQLRFSTASTREISEDPRSFLRSLRFVNIPPDCMFTVRFGGETWHQFYPLSRASPHPVFFALSCHTNELGGNLPEELRRKVLANEGDIPSLTELPPPEVLALLRSGEFRPEAVPTTALSLDAPEGTFHRVVCNTVRGGAGRLRGAWGAWKSSGGYFSHAAPLRPVAELPAPPENSLLRSHLAGIPLHHEDTFCLSLQDVRLDDVKASRLLEAVLEGFLVNAPAGVSRLMSLRNAIVRPLGLRTSPIGCPASPLLAPASDRTFANQYPVLDERIHPDDTRAEVVLGVDDKHLIFRSCVGVQLLDSRNAQIYLGTRVRCKNLFGRFYMASIDSVHRRYISPAMLRHAVDYASLRTRIAGG
jgi:hypothetical protein